jgi:hypothetical protein
MERPGRHDSLTAFSFDGGLVLLDGEAKRLFAYNPSAVTVWRALARGEDAAACLHETYGVSREQASRDAAAIIDEWRAQGLLPAGLNRDGAGGSGVAALSAVSPQASGARSPATCGVYAIGGRRFAIACEDQAVATRVEALFRSFRIDGVTADHAIHVVWAPERPGLVVTIDGQEILPVDSLAEAIGAVFQTVLGGIYAGTDWLAICHGGALATGGRAVLLPGVSGSGKSTLGAFLLSCGFEPLCDDMAAVTDAGSVASWPVPISVKAGSWAALAPHLPALESTRDESVHGRTMKLVPVATTSWVPHVRQVAAIVFPRFDSTAVETTMVELRPLEVLRRLIADRIWLGYPISPASVERFLSWLGPLPSYDLCYSGFDGVLAHVRRVAGHG